MSLSNFPTSLDSWVDKTNNVDDVVASHINKLQDSIAALEAKVGIDDSGVTTSLDYQIGDNIRQVNLLTNSGFSVWSNSTLRNVGSQITLTDVTSGVCLTADTQDIVIGKLFKFDSGDFSGNVYEVTAVTVDVSFTVHDTSITDSGTPGTGYEVTPGCVAADSNALDGWYKRSSLDIYREHNDSNTKEGSFYSLKLVPGDTNDYLNWPSISIYNKETFYKKFTGRPVTYGIWAKTSTASHIRLRVQSDVGAGASSYHTGGGGWEWLEATYNIPTNITYLIAKLDVVQSSGDAYVSQPMLVFGSSIGEGNYVAPQSEIILFEKSVVLTDFNLDSFSSATNQDLNLEAASDGKIPKGAKFINLRAECRDSGSAANLICGFTTGEDDFTGDLICYCSGLTNDARTSNSSMVRCNSVGDIAYTTVATGTDTLDVRLNVFGISM